MITIRIKRVLRWDSVQHKLRLFRLMWERCQVGDGQGYSAKLSVALAPRLWHWLSGGNGWSLSLLGLTLSYRRSYGGIFA